MNTQRQGPLLPVQPVRPCVAELRAAVQHRHGTGWATKQRGSRARPGLARPTCAPGAGQDREVHIPAGAHEDGQTRGRKRERSPRHPPCSARKAEHHICEKTTATRDPNTVAHILPRTAQESAEALLRSPAVTEEDLPAFPGRTHGRASEDRDIERPEPALWCAKKPEYTRASPSGYRPAGLLRQLPVPTCHRPAARTRQTTQGAARTTTLRRLRQLISKTVTVSPNRRSDARPAQTA